MQITYLNVPQVADVLEESATLARIEGPGATVTHLLSRFGLDVIMVTDCVTGEAIFIEPDCVDHDRGGSIHHHARRARDDSETYRRSGRDAAGA